MKIGKMVFGIIGVLVGIFFLANTVSDIQFGFGLMFVYLGVGSIIGAKR